MEDEQIQYNYKKVKQPCQKCFSYQTEIAGIDYSDEYGDSLLKCNNCGYVGKYWTGAVFFRKFDKAMGDILIKESNSASEEENKYTVVFRPFEKKLRKEKKI